MRAHFQAPQSAAICGGPQAAYLVLLRPWSQQTGKSIPLALALLYPHL